ncbi:unnamed protein product [Trifolium pratense]|uniref:Uncharacterized protein n=1 Tax=Trifolium pratense TaxID=57577 RepID=A0ACB0KPJ8_TRIPR|nr:unnamed protein product [Trifolium pratense]
MAAILKFIYAMFLFISLFMFPMAIESKNCQTDEECLKNYRCPPHLSLQCIHGWCECEPPVEQPIETPVDLIE